MVLANIFVLITYNFLPHELSLYTGSIIGHTSGTRRRGNLCRSKKKNQYLLVERGEDVTCVEGGGGEFWGVLRLHIYCLLIFLKRTVELLMKVMKANYYNGVVKGGEVEWQGGGGTLTPKLGERGLNLTELFYLYRIAYLSLYFLAYIV